LPKILIVQNITIFVYSGDISEKRRHIHIEIKKRRHRKSIKFWIEPQIEIVDKNGLNDKEISNIKKIIISNIDLINRQLDQFYQGKYIKLIRL
jgi:hypothetical protein